MKEVTSTSTSFHNIADEIRFYKGNDNPHKILDRFFSLKLDDQRLCLAYLMGRLSIINEVEKQ